MPIGWSFTSSGKRACGTPISIGLMESLTLIDGSDISGRAIDIFVMLLNDESGRDDWIVSCLWGDAPSGLSAFVCLIEVGCVSTGFVDSVAALPV